MGQSINGMAHILVSNPRYRLATWKAIIALLAVALSGCSGADEDGDSRLDRCRRLHDSLCGARARCKVFQNFSDPGAGVVDASYCSAMKSTFVDACTEIPAFQGIETATDPQLQACLDGFDQYACADMCGKVAPDPPACAAVKSVPTTTKFECAP